MLMGKKNLSGDKKQAFNACIYVGKKDSFSIPPTYHTRMLLVVLLATDYEISMAGLSIRYADIDRDINGIVYARETLKLGYVGSISARRFLIMPPGSLRSK